MNSLPTVGIRVSILLLFLAGAGAALAVAPATLEAQQISPRLREAYFRALADHFQVPPAEVTILGDWELESDEVPVVLFLAEKAGVSPDVLIGLRRSGRPWQDVAKRFGLGVQSFYVPLPAGEPLGHLGRAYAEFRGRSASDWDQITLDDPEIVSLVNLRVLSEQVGGPPLRVLQSRESAGSFAAGLAELRGLKNPG